MTIKAFAFEVQSKLSNASGIALKRSHVHEVLAALFGFSSYAALTNQRVIAQHDGGLPVLKLDVQRAASRAMELGYLPPGPPLIAATAASAVEAARICVLPIDAVLYELGVEFDDPQTLDSDVHRDSGGTEAHDFDEEDEGDDDGMLFSLDLTSPLLRESLTRLADAGNALAHLALAKLCDETLVDLDEEGGDGRFWFEEQQRGRRLEGVEIEWAAAYRQKLEATTSRAVHLRHAIQLGNAEAALRQSEIEPTDENFDQAARLAGVKQAARLADLALVLGRDEDARQALRVLAMRGDTSAMKELAGGLEKNLKEAWTWVHLARMLGVDVMAYHAVGENGWPADADESGPIYASGGFDLEDLPNEEDLEALKAARQIFENLSATGSAGETRS